MSPPPSDLHRFGLTPGIAALRIGHSRRHCSVVSSLPILLICGRQQLTDASTPSVCVCAAPSQPGVVPAALDDPSRVSAADDVDDGRRNRRGVLLRGFVRKHAEQLRDGQGRDCTEFDRDSAEAEAVAGPSHKHRLRGNVPFCSFVFAASG